MRVKRLAVQQPEQRLERRGPPLSAAFDPSGAPTRAAQAFAASCGVGLDTLERRREPKGEFLYYTGVKSGAATAELLPGIVHSALEALPIPRRMRWGTSEAQFVRPVHWVVLLFGREVVPTTVLESTAGRLTWGHRFHAPKPLRLTSPGAYERTLAERGHVVADFAARRERIRAGVTAAATELGGEALLSEALLDEVKGSEEEAVVNEIAIRSMAKAVYTPKNIGHYGLGFKNYTHFTSPIRRFPDLIVHRLIYEIVEKNNFKKHSLEELDDICDHASAMERNSVSAERLSVKLKQVEYLKDKVGETFHGVISGFTNFGFFVELSQTLAEGLIRFRDLTDDFYILDDKNYCIVGKDSGKRIRLGDKVNVKILRVNEERKEIDFTLLNG